MNKVLKIIALLCILSLVTTFFAACGGNSGSSTDTGTSTSSSTAAASSSEQKSQDVSLRFAWWGGDTRHQATLAAIDAYTKLNPNVKISAEYMGYDGYQKKLITQFSGGMAPDIFQGVPAWFADIATENYIDLNKYSNIIDTTAFGKALIDENTFNNKLQAISAGFICTAMMYNKDFYQKFGIPEDTVWTWDKILEVGKAVHEKDKNAYLLTGDLDVINRLIVLPYLQQKSGEIWIKDDYTITVDKALLTETLQYLSDLFTTGTLEPLGSTTAFIGKMDQNPKWIKGEIGSVIALTSNFSAMKAAIPNGQFDVTDLPKHADRKDSANWVRSSVVYSVNSASKAPEEAVKFLNWLVNDKDAALILGVERGTPSSDIARKAITDAGKMDTLIAKAMEFGIKDPGKVPNAITENNEISQINKDVITEIGFGKTTPEKGADEILKGYEAKLKELKDAAQ